MLPVCKRRRLDERCEAVEAAIVAVFFIREMAGGGPAPEKRRRRHRGDEESCDTQDQTLQFHLARALDHQLLIAGVGGLQTWIAEPHWSSHLSPTG